MRLFRRNTIGSSPVIIHPAANGANPGTLGFEADWGGTTAIGTWGGVTNFTPITGGDDGFTWPVPLFGNTIGALHNIDTAQVGTAFWDSTTNTVRTANGPGAGSAIFGQQIISRVRYDDPSGNGKVMHLSCPQVAYEDSMQNDLEWQPTTDVTDLYVIMDLEYHTTFASPPQDWWEIFDFKTSDYLGTPVGGYRLAFYIQRNNSNGTLHFSLHGDNDAGGTPFWEQDSADGTVPIGTPFRIEWAFHKANASTYPTLDSTCWSWIKLNGARLLRQDGPGTVTNNNGGNNAAGFMTSTSPINRFIGPIVYTEATRPCDLYFGHYEIWYGADFDVLW